MRVIAVHFSDHSSSGKEMKNRKILIIEDDPELLGLMRHVMERDGYLVYCAANGPDGILRNTQENPDLIILDLHMPEMDGIETLRIIRESDDSVLVVILTGYASPDTIRAAADLNVSEYLSKPFENQELVSVIGSVFKL
jgi:two-component system response regulator (stage 0 sporulation protein F)